ncbi:MAG TPA: fumarylacetoacetate hydrolase family protein [Steroidobacteraceae bacterium]|jgi:2-oxo-3-hexenedioate decarboxylase
MKSLDALSEMLDDAARYARAVAQLPAELNVEDAYEIQKKSIDRRLRRGEFRIGMKMGFTSRAKMVQMGVSDLIWGRLTDAMIREEGGMIRFTGYVHPRVEPEVAFVLRKPLSGRVTIPQALDAVEAIVPALEIIDSRYEHFKFSLTDVIADNSSASSVVLGGWHLRDTDVANLGMILSVNGRPKAFGSTAAILGGPVRSLVSAARMAGEAGEELTAGSIVMAGGATEAISLSPGASIDLDIERLGRVTFTVST